MEFCCCNLNFRYRTCFKQGVHWNSGNYRVKIHSKTRTWHDNNIQTVKCTAQISTHNTAQSFRSVWLNGWVFPYELSGCEFEFRWDHSWSFQLFSNKQKLRETFSGNLAQNIFRLFYILTQFNLTTLKREVHYFHLKVSECLEGLNPTFKR